ncbi:acetylcholinesterase-like [Diadema antillarum]|uniref:acetylcholinesterase-like n=1 Tax=Diadema antillarum TaxID=105358 RepID=UPI003A84D868
MGNQPYVDVPDFGTIYGESVPYRHDYPDIDTNVNIYRGIPYAKNASNYRFMRPEPKLTLDDGVLNATTSGSMCWQLPDMTTPGQSEDCLFLDVWTPSPQPTDAPVMVWIHGGAFLFGSGSSTGYDGHMYCAEHGIIFVAINYRLNGFGFLSTGDTVLPGMYGMFDQLEALKWVKSNIHAFGGNPDEVTIFGQSAGGGSVGLHLLSPESAGYFNRAILISGTATSPWAVETDGQKARDDAFAVGRMAGCGDVSSSQEIVTCLRGVPEEELVLAMNAVMLTTTHVIPLVPTVDGAFLPDDPVELVRRREFNMCPIMVGTTKDDGSLVASRAFPAKVPFEDPSIDEAELRESFLQFTYTYSNDVIVDAMMQQYVDWTVADDPEANFFYYYMDAETDEAFACPADGWARAYAEIGQDVYYYQFTHYPNTSAWSGDGWPWKGVAHGEDLQFIFGFHFNPAYDRWDDMPQKEIELSLDIIRYYANFAKTGNPNLNMSGGTPDTSSKSWPAFTLPDLEYKILDLNLSNGRALKAETCHFWNEYLPSLVSHTMDMPELEQQWREDYEQWKTVDMVAWQDAFEDYKANTPPC